MSAPEVKMFSLLDVVCGDTDVFGTGTVFLNHAL
jgi:hypothetical protein